VSKHIVTVPSLHLHALGTKPESLPGPSYDFADESASSYSPVKKN
jgi:hypothetical protein